jgi:nicotinamide mononucleotide (NMN) deamidase PncC
MNAFLNSPSDLVERIHAAGTKIVLVITGGGSGAISALLEVPGASKSVLEAIVPYAATALTDWLGATPEHFCSSATARAMAMASFQRAQELEPTTPLAGIGCTASLVSDRPKRGPHRIHVGIQTAASTAAYSLELTKDVRTRHDEEQMATRLTLNAVAEAVGVAERIEIRLREDEQLVTERFAAPTDWQDLLSGRLDAVAIGRQPEHPFERRPRLLFPGAFNPRHAGHLHMAALAEKRLALPVEHEISVINVDKPPLDFLTMRTRASQFSEKETLWFTRADTFVKKAAIFPGSTFMAGIDTVARIGEPRYYGNDPAACKVALLKLASLGCRFLVFGRKTADGFHTLSNTALPDTLARICDEVPESEFREDVSSTELRAASGGD